MRSFYLQLSKYYRTYIGSVLFRKRRPQEKENRWILITRFDGLGDFFILLPFLEHLLENGYHIACVSNKSSEEILTHLKLPVTFIPFGNKSVHDFEQVLQKVNKHSYDFALNLSMNIWGGFIVNQSYSKIKIGLLQEKEHYVYKGANLFYDKTLSYDPSMHSFDVLQKVFTETIHVLPAPPAIKVHLHNSNFIIIHPYAKWKPRQWPHFAALIQELTGMNYSIRILGTKKEHDNNAWRSCLNDNKHVEFLTLSSITELMSEIDNAHAFIGNDSGPAHYAALIGKPTTVIWGPGFYERIHPVGKNVAFCKIDVPCRPCRQKGDICKMKASECLLNVTPQMVLQAFQQTLQA